MMGQASGQSLPHVVILGGGFAGLEAAKTLRKAAVRLTLIDRQNHHLFQPLLYQVATASLNPSDIAAPIRRILRGQKNLTVIMARATEIDVASKAVVLDDGRIPFDYLMVATGVKHAYFGKPEWEKWAPGLKSMKDALEIRERVVMAYEAAERETDPDRRAELLTFVIVGAGPTGAELAGALSEIARWSMRADFRNFDPASARVVLLEGTDRVLPAMAPDLSAKAERQLRKLGVEVRTGAFVTAIDGHGVMLGDERIRSRVILWAAGVAASPVGATLGVAVDGAGRVIVEPDLSISSEPSIFVAGDLVSMQQNGVLIPGVAPAAMQQGRHVARNIQRSISGKPTLPFHYVDKGSLATLGKSAAVAQIGKIKLSGTIAWLAWALIHVYFLVGFRNRFFVLVEWARSYFTSERQARLVTNDVEDVFPPDD